MSEPTDNQQSPQVRDWRSVRLEFPDGSDQPPIFVDGEFRSLPLFTLEGRTQTDIPSFKSGSVRIYFRDPGYGCKIDGDPAAIVQDVARKPEIGIRIAKTWLSHVHLFSYFVQFEFDESRAKVHDLKRHTEIVSLFSDCLLAIDTSDLWRSFDSLLEIEHAYNEHRVDSKRDSRYDHHKDSLQKARSVYESSCRAAHRTIERIQRTLEAWKSLGIAGSPPTKEHRSPNSIAGIKAFISYAHQDDSFRIELEKHLATMRQDGSLETWSDKCIVAGQEWEKEILGSLERANLILLLISADFLNSDFCLRREFGRALERHQNGDAVVVPIILRHCDWKSTPIVQFQALPSGARPVKSWADMDEAFADVVQGLRTALNNMPARLAPPKSESDD